MLAPSTPLGLALACLSGQPPTIVTTDAPGPRLEWRVFVDDLLHLIVKQLDVVIIIIIIIRKNL